MAGGSRVLFSPLGSDPAQSRLSLERMGPGRASDPLPLVERVAASKEGESENAVRGKRWHSHLAERKKST